MKQALRNFFILLAALLPFASPGQTNTSAKLLLEKEMVRPGETLWAGIQLTMNEGWHTYWKNPGIGEATSVKWELPDGFKAGEIHWPVPEKYDYFGLITYVYHGQALLLVPIEVPQGASPGKVAIQGRVSWLECKEICLPGSAPVQASFEVGPESRDSKAAPAFAEARKKLANADPVPIQASWQTRPDPEERLLILEWEAAEASQPDFFPHVHGDIEIEGKTQILTAEPGKVRLSKLVKKTGEHWPEKISGLVVTSPEKAFETEISVSRKSVFSNLGTGSFWTMLGLAFLGGLILNIMPCVLPVIALKILGFVQQSHSNPKEVRKLGVVYTLGVIFSFLVLAGVVIAVQKAGSIASWGMQMQNPFFLFAMTVLVLVVALNLFGVFEINLTGRTMGAAGNLASKEGSAGAFFNGMLATILATPCTAPFLGVALGFAFLQPPPLILLMFVVVGLGLASPYLLLSWHPAWLRFLPKPGPWMEKFKVAMGFPMLATGLWLFSLLFPHFGGGAALWLGLFFVLFAFSVWIWGAFLQGRTGRKWIAWAAILLLMGSAYGLILEEQLNWRHPGQARAEGLKWEPWSAEAVAQARAEGRPVLVDFTADWCLSCQVNKTRGIEVQPVVERLKQMNFVTLLGDFTNKDPEMAEEIQRHQRAGVPLVLIYPPDPDANPIILPERMWSPKPMLQALDQITPAASQTARVE